MPEQTTIQKIGFPEGGLNRRAAYSDQPPNTTLDCKNVRPFGAIEGRQRGGTRPGVGKAFGEMLGGAAITAIAGDATGATSENPGVITSVAHGLLAGDLVYLSGIPGAGVAGQKLIDGGPFTVTLDSGTPLDKFHLSLEYKGNGSDPIQLNAAFWGTPVRMISSVTSVPTDQIVFVRDDFIGSALSSVWSAGNSSQFPEGNVLVNAPGTSTALQTDGTFAQAKLFSAGTDAEARGSVRGDIDINTSKAFTVGIFITPTPVIYSAYNIMLYMDNTALDHLASGVRVILTLYDPDKAFQQGGVTEGQVFINFIERNASAEVSSDSVGFSNPVLIGVSNQPGLFSVSSDGHATTPTITVRWRGDLLYTSSTLASRNFLPLQGVGFGFTGDVEPPATDGIQNTFASVDYFSASWTDDVANTGRHTGVVAAAGGRLYYEEDIGVLAEVSTANANLAKGRTLIAAEHRQLLYIADYDDDLLEGTDGVAAGASEDEIDAASVSDWTVLTFFGGSGLVSANRGIDKENHIIRLFNKTTGDDVVEGTYTIKTVASGNLTLDVVHLGDGNSVSWEIRRSPKIFNPVGKTLTQWIADTISAADITGGYLGTLGNPKGEVPIGCHLMCRWRDRLVMAGNPAHAWFMSRQGDAKDFHFGHLESDKQRAILGVAAQGGAIGTALTALIPFSDDLLVFGTISEMWVMRGDPAVGGRMKNLSDVIGCVGPNSFCRTPEGALVFLSRDGIYILDPGSNSSPQSISRKVLPEELKNLSPVSSEVSLEFDVARQGINIFVSPAELSRGSEKPQHFWFDWSTKSFWLEEFAGTDGSSRSIFDPMATFNNIARESGEAAVLLGSRGGFVNKYFDGRARDDGTTFSSHILLGPFRPGGNEYNKGKLVAIIGTLPGGNTGTKFVRKVDWSVLIGETHEDLADPTGSNVTTRASGTWTNGRNFTKRPAITTGSYAILLQKNSANARWGLENIVVKTRPVGKQRI